MTRSSSASSEELEQRMVRTDPARRRAEGFDLRSDDALGDRFFRHLVFNLRAGVLAITRDGRVAAMNDLRAPRPRFADASERHRPSFFRSPARRPRSQPILQQAFETDDLPNRAEMRLRKTGRAVGYTISHIHDDDGRMVGATLFFKDLTRVEQIEERERLRDRLATLGEMAAPSPRGESPSPAWRLMTNWLRVRIARLTAARQLNCLFDRIGRCIHDCDRAIINMAQISLAPIRRNAMLEQSAPSGIEIIFVIACVKVSITIT